MAYVLQEMCKGDKWLVRRMKKGLRLALLVSLCRDNAETGSIEALHVSASKKSIARHGAETAEVRVHSLNE